MSALKREEKKYAVILLTAGAAVILMICAGMAALYRYMTRSGILLYGTWVSQDAIIKTDGKTAELYRDGAAESAVLSIYEVEDRLISEGEIEYRGELCFERRCEGVVIVYCNRSGEVSLVVSDEGGEEGVFERE